jgi:hypothetical protein
MTVLRPLICWKEGLSGQLRIETVLRGLGHLEAFMRHARRSFEGHVRTDLRQWDICAIL